MLLESLNALLLHITSISYNFIVFKGYLAFPNYRVMAPCGMVAVAVPFFFKDQQSVRIHMLEENVL